MAVPGRETVSRVPILPRRIIGIDPGTMVTGWGVVEAIGASLNHIAHGTIPTVGAPAQADRLSLIYRGVEEVIQAHKPDGMSLEKVFFARNAQSALKLGQARGVALLAAAHHGVAVHEYAAVEIKMAVVGYGQASKEQVQKMVAALLHVGGKMAADAADALAAAVCHLHRESFQSRILEALPGECGGAPRRKGRKALALLK
jgi:crossover junction endodeoxyribonuclease RuvC